MKDKTQNEKHNSGRLGSNERDGISQVRIAWPEKVVAALASDGTEYQGKWMTHKAVYKRLVDMGHEDAPKSLTLILQNLTKSGHVERAARPVKENRIRQEYIYRRTGKAFKAQVMGKGFKNGTNIEDLNRGFQIYRDHPRLPKWFRDMML